MAKINHLHLMLRAECESAPGPNDETYIYNKVKSLVRDIKMSVFMEPNVKYMNDVGNEGLTFLVGLETSHSSFHAWDKPDRNLMTRDSTTLLQMDCYTCGSLGFDEISEILKFIAEYNPQLINLLVFDRSKHHSLDSPIIKIKYDSLVQGPYLGFLDNLEIDYTAEFKISNY